MYIVKVDSELRYHKNILQRLKTEFPQVPIEVYSDDMSGEIVFNYCNDRLNDTRRFYEIAGSEGALLPPLKLLPFNVQCVDNSSEWIRSAK